MVLHNGLTVTSVVYDMFLENRGNVGTLSLPRDRRAVRAPLAPPSR